MSDATIRKSFVVAGLFAIVAHVGAAAAAEAHRHLPGVGAELGAILGPDTEKVVATITEYDPDDSSEPVEDADIEEPEVTEGR